MSDNGGSTVGQAAGRKHKFSANRRAKGLCVGRKPISTDPARLQALRSEGQTIREIAHTLGCSPALVHKTLSIPAA